jgi:hypothetical protein
MENISARRVHFPRLDDTVRLGRVVLSTYIVAPVILNDCPIFERFENLLIPKAFVSIVGAEFENDIESSMASRYRQIVPEECERRVQVASVFGFPRS